MPNSLFVEYHDDGIAFYINGDLQFDTADEAIYHEYLVIPTVLLAIQRYPQTDLRVLICGGGDGLAVRDILQFPQVKAIDLVDYNPEVIELAKTVFKPYNLGSLEQEKVTVYTQEAFEFVSQISENYYHVVICDFTYPNSSEETRIYSYEWFAEIKRVLQKSGVICTNSVSPDKNTVAFWCLYQTMLAANLSVKPLQLEIPSFRWHGYGNWGFLLASPQVITRDEIENIRLPEKLQYLSQNKLLEAFVFAQAIAQSRYQVKIHSLAHPQLFDYLLNHTTKTANLALEAEEYINFLEINEAATSQLGNGDSLELENIAKFWLENIYSTSESPELNRLLPARHRYHNSKMTSAWLAYIKEILAEIDIKSLLNSLLSRAQELPPQIAHELQQLAKKINSNQPLNQISPKTAEFIMLLSLTLLMANLVAPDSVFAKGSYYSNSDYSGGDSGIDGKIFGLTLIGVGGFWLFNIFTRSSDE